MVRCERDRHKWNLFALDSLWHRSSLTSRWASPFGTLRRFHTTQKQGVSGPLGDFDSDIEIFETATSSQNEDEKIFYEILGKPEQHTQQPAGQQVLVGTDDLLETQHLSLLEPRSDSVRAESYVFKLPHPLLSEMSTLQPLKNDFYEIFPALRYYIENLP
jgi:hypothetical protein